MSAQGDPWICKTKHELMLVHYILSSAIMKRQAAEEPPPWAEQRKRRKLPDPVQTPNPQADSWISIMYFYVFPKES